MPENNQGDSQGANGQGAKKKGSKMVLIIVVAVVVAGLGVAGFAFKDKLGGVGGGEVAQKDESTPSLAPSEPMSFPLSW